jgi:hypothetical protein
VNQRKHINKVARRYLFEMARMVQFGGETLFVTIDGNSTERPDQRIRGLSKRICLGMVDGSIGSFDLNEVRVRGVQVVFYMEVERKKLDIQYTIQQDGDNRLRFSDGSVLSGPHLQPVIVDGKEIGAQAMYSCTGGEDGRGGEARQWGEKWAVHCESTGDDDEILPI